MTTDNDQHKKPEPAASQDEIAPAEEKATSPTKEESPAEGVASPGAANPGAAPADPAVDVTSMQKEIEKVRANAAEYLDGWQRSIAEFSNYKKRIERDREQVQQALAGTIVKRYLEIVDDLERALKTRPNEGDGAMWANGVELIYRKLVNLLDSQDVKPMDALGQPFDPNRHEAIGQMESTVYPSGHIAEVVQNGYLIGDRVLRPALVRIVN
jgi:molecular chaperone GrpE